MVLAAILATIHLGLMPSGDGRGITVALNAERNQGHVWIHDLAIAAEVDTPQIRTQSVLRHRPYVASAGRLLCPLGTLNFVETSQEGSLALSEKHQKNRRFVETSLSFVDNQNNQTLKQII